MQRQVSSCIQQDIEYTFGWMVTMWCKPAFSNPIGRYSYRTTVALLHQSCQVLAGPGRPVMTPNPAF